MDARLAAVLLAPALAFSAGALAQAAGDQAPRWIGSGTGQATGPNDQALRGQFAYQNEGRQGSERPQRPQRPQRPERPQRPANPPASRPGGGRYRDRPPARGDWHGDRRVWNGRVYWRSDIRAFPRYDWHTWRGGYWHHGWYGNRWGWWWIAGGIWFWYPYPIYPYPNPYVPGTVTVINTQPAPPAAPAEAPAAQYWYHCTTPEGYYPYVSDCPGGWTKVPATPPAATTPPAAKPPPPATR